MVYLNKCLYKRPKLMFDRKKTDCYILSTSLYFELLIIPLFLEFEFTRFGCISIYVFHGKESKYDQKLPQSHTADQPTAL